MAFTFHYVSILIRSAHRHRSSPADFTFHYVSILIAYELTGLNHHSRLYIPLCLYFNPSPSPPLCIALILSLFVDLVYCSCPVLHFRFYLCAQWAFSPYFSCVFRILSTLWVLGLIGGRQSEQEVCCIVGFAPKFFVQPLFLPAFKDDDRVKFLIYCFFQFLLQLQQLYF